MPIIQIQMKFQNKKGENMMKKENRPGAPTPGRKDSVKHTPAPYRLLTYLDWLFSFSSISSMLHLCFPSLKLPHKIQLYLGGYDGYTKPSFISQLLQHLGILFEVDPKNSSNMIPLPLQLLQTSVEVELVTELT